MSNPSRVEMSGPLAAFAPGFLEDLLRQGYRPGTAAKQLQLMAHISRWLAAHGLGGGELTAVRVGQFLAQRRASGQGHLVSDRGVGPLLHYLRGVGVAPAGEATAPRTPRELLIDRYSAYLLERRGLSASTVRNYTTSANDFLADRERRHGKLALGELDAVAINAFVLREAKRLSVGSAGCTVTRLRSLLRFLYVEGEIAHDLTGAVPRVARWRLASLMKAVDGQSVARLLDRCDRRDWVGRRDLAVLTLLSRLGLRAGEVCALRLEDIDWRAGEIMVRGKGSREERCRSRSMSAKHSSAGCAAGGRAAGTRLCSRGSARLMAGFRAPPWRTSCAPPAGEPGCRRWALIGCGTPPLPRCCAPGRACQTSARCCATATPRRRRSTRKSTGSPSPRWSSRGQEVRHERSR